MLYLILFISGPAQGRRRGGCFPASAKALLKSGPSVTMDKLRVGDYVLVGNKSCAQASKLTVVYQVSFVLNRQKF